MKRSIFLVAAILLMFLLGSCASNPPAGKQEGKEAVPATPTLATGNEIIFPSENKAVAVSIKNDDVRRAQAEAVSVLVGAMKGKCQWKKALNYYGEKVVIETTISDGFVLARARMDSSLCPEKE